MYRRSIKTLIIKNVLKSLKDACMQVIEWIKSITCENNEIIYYVTIVSGFLLMYSISCIGMMATIITILCEEIFDDCSFDLYMSHYNTTKLTVNSTSNI